MSTSRALARSLPRLRCVPRQLSGPIAQHSRTARCYSKMSMIAVPSSLTGGAGQPSLRLLRRPTGLRPSRTAAAFSTSRAVSHGHVDPPKPGEELYVTIIDKEGAEHKIAVCKGDNLLDIAQAHDLEMEGACGGSCACSTCHVIVTDQDYYDKMPEPDDDENDMLDLAFGLTETSRLGCQVKMTPELDGLKVKLPSMTRNLQSSDFK
ncbi:2Fe-2S ferredoxin-type domain-containing protein [Apodospora peruviana]|uniref:2Fe-2S ferredoxin-type domain-containing protein n=1 Tax=Apodospora peruviana TaxID=516989 RepID=A0AAE0MBS4_9PEZI|nr:2Fe-2S ferredoxin-type domain-containing protein [Apodospora peruviana]